MNMKWVSSFAQRAPRSEMGALLDRFHLAEPLYEFSQRLLPGGQQHHTLLSEDYRLSREQFEKIVPDPPHEDRAKSAWVISSLSTVGAWKLDGVFSLGLRMAGMVPVGVQMTYDPWTRRYYNLFGIRRMLNLRTAKSRVLNPEPMREVVDFRHNHLGIRELLGIQYHQVDIGRIALSNLLNRNKFSRFDLSDDVTLDEVCRELYECQVNVHAAEWLVEHERPHLALLLEKGLSPVAELFGVCVAKGVPVVQYVGSQNMNQYVLKRYHLENRHQHPFSLDPATWEKVKRLSWSSAQDSALLEEFADSYRQGLWFNRKFLHGGKQIKSADVVKNQLGLDPAKKTAVIFSHVLWDATFFYGQGLFDDYETWLLETVRAACANDALNWVVKLHPDLVWKLRYEGYTGELRDVISMKSAVGKFPDHVKLVLPDTDINTYSFFGIADYCLTVRGTIGIEMACHGIPVLTAGTGRYSHLGFTIDSDSAQEYLHRLLQLHTLPSMSAHQTELARRFAYGLFKLRPWTMSSFRMDKMGIERTGHPLDHNLVPLVQSATALARAEDIEALGRWMASDDIDFIR
jgi:hypothetical protein